MGSHPSFESLSSTALLVPQNELIPNQEKKIGFGHVFGSKSPIFHFGPEDFNKFVKETSASGKTEVPTWKSALFYPRIHLQTYWARTRILRMDKSLELLCLSENSWRRTFAGGRPAGRPIVKIMNKWPSSASILPFTVDFGHFLPEDLPEDPLGGRQAAGRPILKILN